MNASGAGGVAGAEGASGVGGADPVGAGGGDCGSCPDLTTNQAAFGGVSCCTSPGNQCGVALLCADCIALDQPGVLDPSCPPEILMLLITVTLPGCCRPDGQCGGMEPEGSGLDLNLGCVRRDTKIIPGEVRRDLIPCTPE